MSISAPIAAAITVLGLIAAASIHFALSSSDTTKGYEYVELEYETDGEVETLEGWARRVYHPKSTVGINWANSDNHRTEISQSNLIKLERSGPVEIGEDEELPPENSVKTW